MSRVADQMSPGWRRSLEPEADLSRMVPAATPTAAPATPIGIAVAQQGVAMPHRAVYNPTPPVKPAAKRSMSCLTMIGMVAVAATLFGALAASLIR
jgi:hypothetical protein